MQVEVETYSGYKADEHPIRFRLNGVLYEVLAVTDRWYGPDDSWFKVQAHDGNLYILRHRPAAGEWTFESFRPPDPTRAGV
jgi:hypothetical protein